SVLAFFNRSIATTSCSAPLAFRAMMASTKGKGYIITLLLSVIGIRSLATRTSVIVPIGRNAYHATNNQSNDDIT
ncbi:hypothetical protein, partial [Nitrosomonas sp.]|uniref:hypothetical protein n=1 Tax=Nitrosomonas sp. TaxID=42353 RepID=UPI00374D80BA